MIVKLLTVSLKAPISSAPPLTVTAVESLKRSAAPKAKAPALTVVAPVYELEPPRDNVPEPALVNPPAPLIVPAKLLLAALNDVVRVKVLPTLTVPPEPESAPTVSLPPKVNVPVFTVTAPLSESLSAPPVVTLPPLNVSAPVFVPLKVVVPVACN